MADLKVLGRKGVAECVAVENLAVIRWPPRIEASVMGRRILSFSLLD